ncbi:beta-fructofuranosidase, insoluble isoenzyme CWINV3-like [Hibiscus syriacus]|uniref:beta-fructofuranosidase, insoluble isoenzyme CWINV3-like n=1 Tax=Hibiscus syriacus TaxID=106335 RepID=UPI001921EA0F|nr:beta-fructofuranosidase, insoluble isoenzyme CWINV3-like [Hibiscus syriacus]
MNLRVWPMMSEEDGQVFRNIWLIVEGKQLLWPIAKIQNLRGNHVNLINKLLEEGFIFEADIEISFEIKDLEIDKMIEQSWTNPQLLCSRKGALDQVCVLMCTNPSDSSLDQDVDKTTYGAFVDVDIERQQLSLRTLIDHSVMESFDGGSKACITSRVYLTRAIVERAHLYVFNYGTQSINIAGLSARSISPRKSIEYSITAHGTTLDLFMQ